MVEERNGAVTLKGKPFTLVGKEIKIGDKAPNFSVVNQNLQYVEFSASSGKIRIINVVYSLDTGICDLQTKRFNDESANLSEDVDTWTISVDLPFNQRRWCGESGVDQIKVLSDHKDLSFGKAFGTLIKELRFLSRAIFVVDEHDVIRYAEYVPEVASHPDYEQALEAVKSLLQVK